MNKMLMAEAVRLSREMMRAGRGGPFGAVVARGGEIVGRGANEVTSTNDPTAHAEVVAIRDACRRLKSFRLEGCEIYCSCEPCPMCLSAIYWAHIHAIYYGNTRQDAAAIGFDDRFIYQEICLAPTQRQVVMSQMMREDALAVFDEWRVKPDKIPD